MLCVTMCVSGCRVIQWTPRAHLRQALKPKISKNSIFEIRLAARSNSNSNWHLHGPCGACHRCEEARSEGATAALHRTKCPLTNAEPPDFYAGHRQSRTEGVQRRPKSERASSERACRPDCKHAPTRTRFVHRADVCRVPPFFNTAD